MVCLKSTAFLGAGISKTGGGHISEAPALLSWKTASSGSCAGLQSHQCWVVTGPQGMPPSERLGWFCSRCQLWLIWGQVENPGLDTLLCWTSTNCHSRLRKRELVCHPWVRQTLTISVKSLLSFPAGSTLLISRDHFLEAFYSSTGKSGGE